MFMLFEVSTVAEYVIDFVNQIKTESIVHVN